MVTVITGAELQHSMRQVMQYLLLHKIVLMMPTSTLEKAQFYLNSV